MARFNVWVRSGLLLFAGILFTAGSAAAIDATGLWDVTWTFTPPFVSTNQCVLTQVGAGANLNLPAGQLPTPVHVQLQGGSNACWEDTYSNPSLNNGTRFKVLGD